MFELIDYFVGSRGWLVTFFECNLIIGDEIIFGGNIWVITAAEKVGFETRLKLGYGENS